MSTKDVDTRVMEVLRDRKAPSEPQQIVEALQPAGLDEVSVLGSVWRLVDQNQAQFTPDRKLEIVTNTKS